METRRNAVTKKEIILYVKWRIKRLKEEILNKDEERNLLILEKRRSELDRLLRTIDQDTIRADIELMKKHHYTRSKFKEKDIQDKKSEDVAK